MIGSLLQRLLGREGAAVPVVLYTRDQCPLCERMKEELARATVRQPFELREVDVDGDPALRAAHGDSVPVVEVDGRVAFFGSFDARSFARALEQAGERLRAR